MPYVNPVQFVQGNGTYYANNNPPDDIAVTNNMFTISLWLYESTSGYSDMVIAQQNRDSNIEKEWYLYIKNYNKLIFWDYHGGYGFADDVNNNQLDLTTGVWTHVAFVRNGTQGKWYKDGVHVKTITASKNVQYGATNTFCIGKDYRNDNRNFVGSIGPMQLFAGMSLSTTDVNHCMNMSYTQLSDTPTVNWAMLTKWYNIYDEQSVFGMSSSGSNPPMDSVLIGDEFPVLTLEGPSSIDVMQGEVYDDAGATVYDTDTRGVSLQKYNGYYWDNIGHFTNANKSGTAMVVNKFSIGDEGSYYSYKATGYFVPLQSGTYYLKTASDDASHVYVDGALLVNNGGTHGTIHVEGSFAATAGQAYLVEIYFGEYNGGASINFYWRGDVGPQTTYTSNLLTHGYWHHYIMNVTTVNPVDTSTPGTYTITYDAQDQSGNTATQLTRTVNVVGSSGSASISGTLTQNNTLTAVLDHSIQDPATKVYEWRRGNSGGAIIGTSINYTLVQACLLYTSPSPRDLSTSRMPSSA